MTKENRSDKQYLLDISDAIDSIDEFLMGKSRGEFEKSDLLQSAVTRQFEIIGEAASRLTDSLKEKFKDVKWSDVVGMRHKMIHDYFEVSLDIVWDTAKNDLKNLQAQIKKIYKELN